MEGGILKVDKRFNDLRKIHNRAVHENTPQKESKKVNGFPEATQLLQQ